MHIEHRLCPDQGSWVRVNMPVEPIVAEVVLETEPNLFVHLDGECPRI